VGSLLFCDDDERKRTLEFGKLHKISTKSHKDLGLDGTFGSTRTSLATIIYGNSAVYAYLSVKQPIAIVLVYSYFCVPIKRPVVMRCGRDAELLGVILHVPDTLPSRTVSSAKIRAQKEGRVMLRYILVVVAVIVLGRTATYRSEKRCVFVFFDAISSCRRAWPISTRRRTSAPNLKT
jgi:hypothetical protein